ncbi:thiamine pyrophosphate-dependent dehydrogenase E1 component subunit alpha [Cupriavidus gilardii]|uniref:thiamine pyrophosphate-dependent dehydrogenase E1 component subunit alpha n=1 Tax=Cupriavidus gilardii TaxID=82541 RepID=UPI00158014B7|nr:thiamine pyrophosphate-dependent dehydrogenase E1 component subunit alpha [Cupriavidus gilardii]MCT9070023.1 thiamine pyrophosphate-dependent dehydrogenase E1 component subunit alpha [Cupriavidus gilardii]QKS61992.1 thiamine pyrophosphate-dependent dehydrogenase E1 component subunit alpha [Cupriavidus gilardii]
MEPTTDQLLWMYEKMVEIRHYEETMAKVYLEGKLPPKIQKGLAFDIGAGPVPGEMHLAAGQEPVAVGVCAHLRTEDTVVGAHRPHHFAIAKGVPLDEMTAEMFGKVTGLGRGKGGHMHLFHPETKFSCSGIVGAGAPQACGAALAARKLGKDWVAIAFFGEGAANQGAFHEALNLAALWKLPVLFVCEDNKYGISVEKSASTSVDSNAVRAAGYGMPGVLVDTNDAVAVFRAAGVAVARARRGEGPTLIEVKTDRYLGHFQGDPETYRPKNEAQTLRRNDPIDRLGKQLREQGLLDDEADAALRRQIVARVDAGYAFGRESPYPAPEEALQHVFA